MTRSLRRALATFGAVGLIALAAPSSATPSDIEALRSAAQRVADRVSLLEHRLADMRARHDRLDDRIAEVDRSLAVLDLRRRDAESAYQAALDDYVERAVAVYKGPSPATSLQVILSARSFSEMALYAHATNATADAAHIALDDLTAASDRLSKLQEDADAHKQRLIATASAIEAVTADMEATLGDRRATLREMNRRINRLEEAARMAAASAPQPDQAFGNILNGSGPSNGIPAGFVGTGVTFEGVASWYGPGFEGNPTANGDIFDPTKFTAASRDLPLGSWLYVEHQGRGVVVYVNDRGPFIEGRILDLSQAAAEAIGITGLGWIEAEVVVKT
jgi:peptidoglycan hydrolase CwlO-like protein/3D (Asp-Asp-Asp) domain-containing protein